MPEMDGIEATRQIKALGGDRWIPLLLITALTSTEEPDLDTDSSTAALIRTYRALQGR